jgi:4'-phosphopantetheinyl transferase
LDIEIGTIWSSSPWRTNPAVCEIGKHLQACQSVHGTHTGSMQQSENQPAGIEIALWQYSKDEGDWNRWMQSLSPDERGRAATYRFERDRASFIAGRYIGNC